MAGANVDDRTSARYGEVIRVRLSSCDVKECAMGKNEIIASLRRHQPELRAAGVLSLSLFGSVARGDDGPSSDVDLAVRLAPDVPARGLGWFSRVAALKDQLEGIVGKRVDIVVEPVRHERLRQQLERDRAVAF